MDIGQKGQALSEFDRAISLDKTTFVAYVFSAGIKFENGDYAGAGTDYRALSRLKPDYYYAHEGIGLVSMYNKEYTQARDAFIMANELALKAAQESGSDDEHNYAILAVINWLQAVPAGKRGEVKPFIESAMKEVKRESLDYAALRLFHDISIASADSEFARKIEMEKDTGHKGRMYYYMAKFYEIRNVPRLADAYFIKCRELGRKDMIEWRLNEWAMDERALALKGNIE
jgi:tetratricopeptide (TPR) repeat protein